MTQSIDPAAMSWVAQQVDHISTVHPNKEQIQQALFSEFHERFPQADLSKYLVECMSERKRALDALSHIPHARSADGSICCWEIIKNTLANNPILSDGEPPKAFPVLNLDLNRLLFCGKVWRIAKYVNGGQIFPGVLAEEVANVQKHILPHENSDFFHPRRDFLDQFLQNLLVTFHLDQDLPVSVNSLDEAAYNILHECKEATLDQIYLAVYRQIPDLLQKSLPELTPAIQGHEEGLREILDIFLTNCRGIQEAIENLADYLELSRQLPVCATEAEFNEKVVQLNLKDQCDELAYCFGGNRTLLFEHITQAKTIGDIDSAQIKFWAANRYPFETKLSQISPHAAEFILRTLKKQKCEGEVSPEIIAAYSFGLLSRLVVFAHHHDIDLPLRHQMQLHAALLVAQGDMFWRTLPLEAAPDSFGPFDPNAPVMETLKIIYEKYRNFHPLLEKNQILSELQQACLLDDEGMWYVYESLKYLWYMRPPDRLRAAPTIRLFLEWHASDILLSTPTISLEELSSQLRTLVDRLIPAYPVSDYDIRQVSQQLLAQGPNLP